MYISAILSPKFDKVYVWERIGDERIRKEYDPELYFYIESDDGEYEDIHERKLEKIEFESFYDYVRARKQYRRMGKRLYESDIPIEQKVLSKHYYNKEIKNLNVTFFDIEVDYDRTKGFSRVENPYGPVNSIAIYHTHSKRRVVLAIPPQYAEWEPSEYEYGMSDIEDRIHDMCEVHLFKTEKELLDRFLQEIQDSDVISGWNCIPIDQSVWGESEILPIKDVRDDLVDSTILTRYPITNKESYKITLENGTEVESSEDHIFPVTVVPRGKYTNLKSGAEKNVDMSVKEISEALEKNVCFAKIPLHDNKNEDDPAYTLDELYLLGLVYTDGSLKNPKKLSNGYTIYQSDRPMLESLPIIESALVGPYKRNYSRHVSYNILSHGHNLIYDGLTKSLNLNALSKLSYRQYMSFLSGMLDGDGYITRNGVELCNYIDGELDKINELNLWNGIFSSKRKDKIHLIHYNWDDLSLRKTSRWSNFTPSLLSRQSKTKAEYKRFTLVDGIFYVRINSIESTGRFKDMMDIETSTHYFYTRGVKCHNCDFFDVPYIYKRIKKVLGESSVNRLCFPGTKPPQIREMTREISKGFTVTDERLQIYGRCAIDYMALYKKFTQENRPSYSLEAIAEIELPDMRKLEYSGSLYELYRNDFNHFIDYNVIDTEIMVELEQKLKYMQLAIQLSHLATGQLDSVYGTIKLAEQAIINYIHYVMGAKVPETSVDDDSSGKYGGAYVLDPMVGEHEMVGSVDVTSLYPTGMICINISPETLVAQFTNNHHDFEKLMNDSGDSLDLEFEDGNILTKTTGEWRKILKQQNLTVSGYGTVYDQSRKGFIPAILEEWFDDRLKFKKEMEHYRKLKDQIEDKESDEYKEASEKAEFYYRMQYIKKIQLNSLYGCLGNRYFKFYDVRMAESTTKTGREILNHIVRQIGQELDGEYKYPNDTVVYGDTDSAYFKTHTDNLTDAKRVCKFIERRVNESFIPFMQNAFFSSEEISKRVRVENEVISDFGIFVSKKIYLLHLVMDDGYEVDKMKIMGHAIKKTTVSKAVKQKLTDLIEGYLINHDWGEFTRLTVEFKNYLMANGSFEDLGIPKKVSKIAKYTEDYKRNKNCRISGGQAAAIHWNEMLEYYDDHETLPVGEGMPVRIYYLTKKYGRFHTIAVPTDVKQLPDWFKEHYLEFVDIDEQIKKLVDLTLNNICVAIGKEIPTDKAVIADELLVY